MILLLLSHIVFAPSSSDSYSSSSFSGLTDLLETVGNQTAVQKPTEWAQIKQHLSVIAFFIETAGRSLSDYLWDALLLALEQINQPLYRVLNRINIGLFYKTEQHKRTIKKVNSCLPYPSLSFTVTISFISTFPVVHFPNKRYWIWMMGKGREICVRLFILKFWQVVPN